MQLVYQDCHGVKVFNYTANPKDALLINAMLSEGFALVAVLDSKGRIWQIHGFILSTASATSMGQQLREAIAQDELVLTICNGQAFTMGPK